MKVGVDLDGVLADYISALVNFHNAVYKTSLTKDDFKSYMLWETWGGTQLEALEKMSKFHQSNYFKDIKPIPGSREAVSLLTQKYGLVVITSRPDSVVEETKNWVAKNFPNCFSGIYFATGCGSNGKTKSQLCDCLGIELFVEDGLEYAFECARPGRKVFLFDSPWNQSLFLPDGVQRVKSWEEIVTKLGFSL